MEALKFILLAILFNMVNAASLKNTQEQNQNKEPVIIVKKYDVEGSTPVIHIAALTEMTQNEVKAVKEEILSANNAANKKLGDEAKTKLEIEEVSRPLVTVDARQTESPNFFEVIYTGITTTFTSTFTRIIKTITEFFASDNSRIYTADQSAVREKLESLQEVLKQGLSHLQKTYDEYVALNKDRDMTEEASYQDEEDAEKLKNQLFELQKTINEGMGKIDQSLNSVLSTDKPDTEPADGQTSAKLDEIIAEFTKFFTQSIKDIEKTIQGLKDRVPTAEHSVGDQTNNGIEKNIQQTLETLNPSIKADDRWPDKSGATQDQGE